MNDTSTQADGSATAKFEALETHAIFVALDPDLKKVKRRFDTCKDATILAEAKHQFGECLIDVVAYDQAVVTINGVKYWSEPINKRKLFQ